MKLATIKVKGVEKACVCTSLGCMSLERLNQLIVRGWSSDVLALIESGEIEELKKWYYSVGRQELRAMKDELQTYESTEFAPLYRRPRKIWGIGLNYQSHASSLSEKTPTTEPASFMKPDTTIIGHGDSIEIPLQSRRTTAEAELGIIIGKKCKNLEPKDWLRAVVGFTTIIDVTAEDVLRKNPRYLTRAKSFDTFFSFGPMLMTLEEVDDITRLQVATLLNGQVQACNTVANMTFHPDFLISFHSNVMTLLPGDIISTGTPGAVPIHDGDVVECRINGFYPLVNHVKDLKNETLRS
jgi:2-keto-4-pentenoate hydratase/2-oxohepta-3-ene-1,7-dioic acid hydratase in catechol pathway